MLNIAVSSKLFGKAGRLRPAMPPKQAEQAQTALGKRIQDERLDRRPKMTQEDLGKRVGVTKGAISQWENGDIKNLRLENLFKLADALGLEARWIATGRGAKYSARKQDSTLDELLAIYDSLDEQGRGIVLLGAKTAKTDYEARKQLKSNASQAK
jgi:transcriptional regulator with XRE-family HTH domain